MVGGTREGTFSAIQTMVNREAVSEKPYVCMPNPYYQIYGGATLFAGAKPHFLNCSEENNFQMDLENVDASRFGRNVSCSYFARLPILPAK